MIVGYVFPKMRKKAFELRHQSALQGDNLGQHNLAYCYEHELGVEENTEQALRWYEKSAVQGLATSQQALQRLQSANGLLPQVEGGQKADKTAPRRHSQEKDKGKEEPEHEKNTRCIIS